MKSKNHSNKYGIHYRVSLESVFDLIISFVKVNSNFTLKNSSKLGRIRKFSYSSRI